MRYALLCADYFSGEGALVPQPWMGKADPMLISDVVSDWSEQAETVSQEGADVFYEDLEKLRPAGNVIPFRRWLRDHK